MFPKIHLGQICIKRFPLNETLKKHVTPRGKTSFPSAAPLFIPNMSAWRGPAFDREPHPVLLPEETFNLSPAVAAALSYFCQVLFMRAV